MAWPLVQASDSKSLLVSGALLKPHTNLFLQLFASILFNREMKRNRNISSKTKTNLSRTNTKSSFPVLLMNPHQLRPGAGGIELNETLRIEVTPHSRYLKKKNKQDVPGKTFFYSKVPILPLSNEDISRCFQSLFPNLTFGMTNRYED